MKHWPKHKKACQLMAEVKEKIWEWPEHQQLEENPLKQQDGFQQLASHDVIILCFFLCLYHFMSPIQIWILVYDKTAQIRIVCTFNALSLFLCVLSAVIFVLVMITVSDSVCDRVGVHFISPAAKKSPWMIPVTLACICCEGHQWET